MNSRNTEHETIRFLDRVDGIGSGNGSRHVGADQPNMIRNGDAVHIDLMLGNHGNEHRDFKLAGKLSLEGATLEVIDPDGKRYDVKDRLIDTGYAPQEGYWTTRFEPAKPGLYRSPTVTIV